MKDPTQKFSAGSMIFVDWYLRETDPYDFTVTYLLGDSNRLETMYTLFHLFIYIYRIAIVHFRQDDTVDNPVLVTFGETSSREYVRSHFA